MDDHLKGADVIGYPDIRISGFSDNRIFVSQSHILRARKLKLGENHVGTCPDVLGYSDIFRPQRHILRTRNLLGYLDIRIS